MGNTESTEQTTPQEVTLSEVAIVTCDDSYKWPDNLYLEARDMAAASFLVYTFGWTLDVARKDGLKGMEVDDQGHMTKQTTTSRLKRSFTPEEVKQLIADNRDALIARYPARFTNSTLMEQSLQIMHDRAVESGLDRPLTLVEFDDHHQDKEMVYAVAKDDVNKRITLAFRGTDTELAMMNNWLTNFSFSKVEADLPDAVKDKPIWFHGGFYNYIFSATAETEDAPDKRKYDEILEDIKPLLKANPGYKLYVTGHSLGGALASIVAFYLACDDDIPSPVTCITFAAPRVADAGFLEATHALEKAKRLRVLRVVNDNDTIAMMPMFNFQHAGFQVRLYNNPLNKPEVTYPKLEDSYWNRFGRAWSNSFIASINPWYDHGEYRERVDENQAFLEQQDLNALYNDKELAGFCWS